MAWVQHVARMGFIRNAYKISVGKTEGRSPLGVDGTVILKRILHRWDVTVCGL